MKKNVLCIAVLLVTSFFVAAEETPSANETVLSPLDVSSQEITQNLNMMENPNNNMAGVSPSGYPEDYGVSNYNRQSYNNSAMRNYYGGYNNSNSGLPPLSSNEAGIQQQEGAKKDGPLVVEYNWD